MIYYDNDTLDGLEEVRSTTLWDQYAIKIRRRYKRFSPSKKTDFNRMMDNIKKSIEDYQNLEIELKRNKNNKKTITMLSNLDNTIRDYIEILTSELMLVILEG